MVWVLILVRVQIRCSLYSREDELDEADEDEEYVAQVEGLMKKVSIPYNPPNPPNTHTYTPFYYGIFYLGVQRFPHAGRRLKEPLVYSGEGSRQTRKKTKARRAHRRGKTR